MGKTWKVFWDLQCNETLMFCLSSGATGPYSKANWQNLAGIKAEFGSECVSSVIFDEATRRRRDQDATARMPGHQERRRRDAGTVSKSA